MPGRPPPAGGLGPLAGGQGRLDTPTGGDFAARPTEMLRAWHALNVAAARSLPTSLVRAGQLKHAGLSALRARGRVKR